MMYRVMLIAVALIGFSAVARADDPANEDIWKQYWMAVDAQKKCNNVDFSQGQYDAMVQVMNQKINNDLGSGTRHRLMSEASAEVVDLTFKYGCTSPQVADLLALYNRDLAPVVQ